ncbi:MAG: IPTL-CTERM sorting domain-containing protein [Phycisphaerae bacterium]|nr:IPTL-CTERM sorting domain-containing protein [Phycisphaerae bacterium]
MCKALKWMLLIVAVTTACAATAGAATWKFKSIGAGYTSPAHPEWGTYNGDGWLTVWPTINCSRQSPPLRERTEIQGGREYTGEIPGGRGYNDYMAFFEWDYPCENKVWYKMYVCKDNELIPALLPEWMDTVLPRFGPVVLPSVADPNGVIPEVYVVVNLRLWAENPQPLQRAYHIQNGECPELPGFRFGTTEFKYQPKEICHPLVTDNPLTGTLYPHAEVTFAPPLIPPLVPTLSQWGLIVVALLLISVGTLAIWRKRQLAV